MQFSYLENSRRTLSSFGRRRCRHHSRHVCTIRVLAENELDQNVKCRREMATAAAAVVSASAVIGEWKLKKKGRFLHLDAECFVTISSALLLSLVHAPALFGDLVAQSTCSRVRFKFSSSNRMPLYWIGPQRIGYRIFLFYFIFFLSLTIHSVGNKNGFTESIELMLNTQIWSTNSFVRFVCTFICMDGWVDLARPLR